MNNKTSFIPKKKYLSTDKKTYKKSSLGLFFKIAVFLFVLSSVFLGGVFGYKQIVVRQLDDLFISMERAKASFDPEFILELDKLSSDVVVVEKLVSEHRSPSKIFDVLEKVVLDDLRFEDFDYSYSLLKQQNDLSPLVVNATESLEVKLKGEAKNFTVLAQQSEVFKNTVIIESFSFLNFVLSEGGNVSFDLEIVFKESIYD